MKFTLVYRGVSMSHLKKLERCFSELNDWINDWINNWK